MISVIIPTYCPGAYLIECLDSLLHQDMCRENYEVIIVLNGPREPYFSSIYNYLKIQHGFLLFYSEIPGVSNARNIGLSLAKGDFITFIDDDDLVSPHYLSGLLESANNNTVSICYPFAFKENVSTQEPYSLTRAYDKYAKKEDLSLLVVSRFFSGPCMKLFHKEIISDRRFDIAFSNGEDSLYMFFISDRIEHIKFASRDVVYYRRIRENSATTRHRSKKSKINNCFRLIKSMASIYCSNPKNYSLSFLIRKTMGAVWGTIR